MPEDEGGKKVPIRRTFRDDTVTLFVNDLLIQHDVDSFILSFFEIWRPAILGESQEETERQLKSIEVVDAKCVARLAVSPEVMRKFVKAMITNLEKFDKGLGRKKNG